MDLESSEFKKEKLSPKWADTCKEYQDAGLPLKPSCNETIRIKNDFFSVVFQNFEALSPMFKELKSESMILN